MDLVLSTPPFSTHYWETPKKTNVVFTKVIKFAIYWFWILVWYSGRINLKGEHTMSNQLIYTGKAKDIYSTEDENNELRIESRTKATMLNGARKGISKEGCAK